MLGASEGRTELVPVAEAQALRALPAPPQELYQRELARLRGFGLGSRAGYREHASAPAPPLDELLELVAAPGSDANLEAMVSLALSPWAVPPEDPFWGYEEPLSWSTVPLHASSGSGSSPCSNGERYPQPDPRRRTLRGSPRGRGSRSLAPSESPWTRGSARRQPRVAPELLNAAHGEHAEHLVDCGLCLPHGGGYYTRAYPYPRTMTEGAVPDAGLEQCAVAQRVFNARRATSFPTPSSSGFHPVQPPYPAACPATGLPSRSWAPFRGVASSVDRLYRPPSSSGDRFSMA